MSTFAVVISGRGASFFEVMVVCEANSDFTRKLTSRRIVDVRWRIAKVDFCVEAVVSAVMRQSLLAARGRHVQVRLTVSGMPLSRYQ